MGFLEDTISGFIEGMEHLVAFVILYTIGVFAIGSFYGAYLSKGESTWYPVYLLFIGLVIYVIREAARPKKKEEKK